MYNRPELPFLVIGYFKSDESVKWNWCGTEKKQANGLMDMKEISLMISLLPSLLR